MARRIALLTVSAGLVLIAGCGQDGNVNDKAASDSTEPRRTTEQSSTTGATTGKSVTIAQSPTIPDGTYSRVIVRADAVASGLDPGLVDQVLGDDGELPVTFKLAGDRWTIFVSDDAGIVEPGDGGTASYNGDGHWVTVSESSGCPDCVEEFDWSLTDHVLTLTLVPIDDRTYDDDERLITEGRYEQTL